MLDGHVYEPTNLWVPATVGTDGSVLPTPTAQLAKHGVTPDVHRNSKMGSNLWDIPHLLPTPVVNDMGAGKTVEWWDAWAPNQKAAARPARQEPVDRGAASVANADSQGLQGHGEEHELPEAGGQEAAGWGDYGAAIQRWGHVIGRVAPAPVVDDKMSSKFVEWMMGLPDGWVTGVGLSRTQELKMLGNGVVPQQAAAAYGWLLKQ